MKTAIILHGMPERDEYYELDTPSQSNRHWFPWLQKQLILKDVLAQTPEMPTPYEPVYEEWEKMFERFDLNKDTMLFGHSLGGGFLLRWLSENDVKVGKVVLVAPWIDPEKIIKSNFFDFKLDEDLASRTEGLYLFASKDDFEDITKSVEEIKSRIKDLKVFDFENKGHFCFEDLGSGEFPELLDVILQ